MNAEHLEKRVASTLENPGKLKGQRAEKRWPEEETRKKDEKGRK